MYQLENKINMKYLLLATIIIAAAICAVAPDYAAQRNAEALQSVNPVKISTAAGKTGQMYSPPIRYQMEAVEYHVV
jgi:hypothetical protein